jgi:hypothetical protein
VWFAGSGPSTSRYEGYDNGGPGFRSKELGLNHFGDVRRGFLPGIFLVLAKAGLHLVPSAVA